MNRVDLLTVMERDVNEACIYRLWDDDAEQRAAESEFAMETVAELIDQRDALLVIAHDFDEVLRERHLRCECGEADCRTSRLDAALARCQSLTPAQLAQGDETAVRA